MTRITQALSVAIAGLGLAMLVVTTARGGGSLGYLLGAPFVGAGAGRFYRARRSG